MKLDLSSIVAGEYFFLGFVLLTVPDLFFNPVDGIFKAISPVRKTSLESGHLDPITSIFANLIGAILLMLAVRLLIADNPMKRNHMLRSCFYSHVFLTLVCGHTAIVQADGNPYLNLPMIGVLAGHFLGYVAWFLVASVNEAAADKMKRTPASWPRIVNHLIMLIMLAPANIMNLVAPHHADPGRTVTLWRRTTLPDNTIDDLAVFHARVFGALGMSYVCSALEVLAFDRTNERLLWFSQEVVVGNVMSMVVMVRAALDTTGYALNGAWAMQSIALSAFLLIQLAYVIWPWEAQVSQKSCAHGESVPGLVVAEDEKKTK